MQVRDDELRVGDVQSIGKIARKIPVSPPKTKTEMNPSAHSIGVSNEMLPSRSVASQLKTFTRDRHGERERREHEDRR